MAKKNEKRKVIIDLPIALKEAVAASGAPNATDEIVGALAEEFGVPFEPSGRPGGIATAPGKIILRMTADLKMRIARRAVNEESNMTDVIAAVLARRYGVEHEPSGVRRGVPVGGGRRR